MLFETREAGPANVVPSADGRLVAVCPVGKAPQVREIGTGRVLPGSWQRTQGLCGADSALVFGAGAQFAAVSEDGVRVWDINSGRPVAEIDDPGARYASFSQDGRFLATAGAADEIRVWRLSDPATPVLRHPLNNQRLHGGLAWDPGSPVLRYLEGSTVHTLDLVTTVTSAWRDRPMGVLLSPDGRVFATAERSGAGYQFQLRDTEDGRLVRTLQPPPPLMSRSRVGEPVDPGDTVPVMVFSPDGGRFVYGVSAPGLGAAPQRFIIWDLTRDREQTALDLATTESGTAVTALALPPTAAPSSPPAPRPPAS